MTLGSVGRNVIEARSPPPIADDAVEWSLIIGLD